MEDYCAHMQQLAKQVGADDTMLRFAILNGLRDDLKSHVTRAQPATLKDLQEAAKIAELCPTEKPRSDDTLAIQLALMQDQLKQVLSNQNTGATKSAPVNQSEDRRPRSPSPKRVQFEDDAHRLVHRVMRITDTVDLNRQGVLEAVDMVPTAGKLPWG